MRHESWMSSEAMGTMIDYRVGFCNLDQPEHVRAMPPTAFLTSPIAYFRLHGRQRAWWWNEYQQSTRPQTGSHRGYAYSPAELAQWTERVEQVRGIAEKSFCFFTNDGGGQAVVNAMQFNGMFARPAKRTAVSETEPVLELAVA
jgi:uncharacterized protein YecE (DUF72 family)